LLTAHLASNRRGGGRLLPEGAAAAEEALPTAAAPAGDGRLLHWGRFAGATSCRRRATEGKRKGRDGLAGVREVALWRGAGRHRRAGPCIGDTEFRESRVTRGHQRCEQLSRGEASDAAMQVLLWAWFL